MAERFARDASAATRPTAAIRADRRRLLDWYRPRTHAYPWRTTPPDPYGVLVSEVMLQQTQAARVVPIFERFVQRFPDLRSLAVASRADVVRAWAGLGYHRRAVSLHETARTIVERHDGSVPGDPVELQALPGIGRYTASAVASIAYGVPVVAVDTNVRRIAARYLHGREAHDVEERELASRVEAWADRARPGEWNQALMDLGREVCRPRPRCGVCPLRGCRFRAEGTIGGPAPRRQPPFEGSNRQLRGRVLAAVRDADGVSVAALVDAAEAPVARVLDAIAGLERDGLVVRAQERVRLAT